MASAVFSYHDQIQGATANLFINHSKRGFGVIWDAGKTFGKIVAFEALSQAQQTQGLQNLGRFELRDALKKCNSLNLEFFCERRRK